MQNLKYQLPAICSVLKIANEICDRWQETIVSNPNPETDAAFKEKLKAVLRSALQLLE